MYQQPIRRKVFVSYHHDNDQNCYDDFSRLFSQQYEIVRDNSLDRKIDSSNTEYVMRQIRENYLTGSTVTFVLCGRETPWRKYVDWEICASLNQKMGLIGVNLPTNPQNANGTYTVPDRLHDNIQSGYAVWVSWSTLQSSPAELRRLIEKALSHDKRLIVNSRPTMKRNGSVTHSW